MLRPDLADDSPGAMPRPPGHHSLTFGVPASPHAVGSRSQKPPAGSPKAFRRELRRRVESLPAGAPAVAMFGVSPPIMKLAREVQARGGIPAGEIASLSAVR